MLRLAVLFDQVELVYLAELSELLREEIKSGLISENSYSTMGCGSISDSEAGRPRRSL